MSKNEIKKSEELDCLEKFKNTPIGHDWYSSNSIVKISPCEAPDFLFQTRNNSIIGLELADIIATNGNTKFSQTLKRIGDQVCHHVKQTYHIDISISIEKFNKDKRKLFDLTQIKGGKYNSQPQHWFARYLDRIKITSKAKVFHSFRHTFETMATEKRIPPQYQNAICGWTEEGIGQRLYAHKKNMKIMLQEISKVSFPINRELSELKKSFMDSFVMRQLRAEGQKEELTEEVA